MQVRKRIASLAVIFGIGFEEGSNIPTFDYFVFGSDLVTHQATEQIVAIKPEQLWEPRMQVGKKVASIQVSHFCFEPKLLFTEYNVALNFQKAGPAKEPSPPPIPSASSAPPPASSMSEEPAPLEDSAVVPAAPSRRRKVRPIALAPPPLPCTYACI